MSSRFTVVESSLNRAEFRWKWLRFVRHSAILGGLLAGLMLMFAAAVQGGMEVTRSTAVVFFVLVGTVGFVAWLVVLIAAIATTPERSWLAATLERVDPRLLDRLNTLLFLERFRARPHADAFSLRIAQQTRAVVADKPSPAAFPGVQVFPHLLAFLVALAATFTFYHLHPPWKHLLASARTKTTTAANADKPLELALPATNNVEQNQNWGEVRITDPGTDIKVTKVDVVPLQIEAAANEPLRDVGWASAINGGEESAHTLAPPTEPRYAAYQPTLYLDEMNLSDFDVMTYYAKANTEKTNSFASDVYFLEVRPFREDIMKMPGGENGKAYQSLNQLSTLIHQQQHVIRQTHQHIQKPAEQETLQAQDRSKLSAAEFDLKGSSDHLYAQMAAEMENRPIGEALDNLAKASKSLDQSGGLLRDNVMREVPNRERQALMELVAARKMFHKAISDNPDAFKDDPQQDDQDTKTAPEPGKKLDQIAEFRNESKAAQQFMQKALDQQKAIEQQAKSPRADLSKLASQEQQLQKSLDNFQQDHPQVFKGAQDEAKSAQQALNKATSALQKGSGDSPSATKQASEELGKLNQAMNSQSAGQQLANAYKLKELLDQQSRALGKFAESTNSSEDVQKLASSARQTVNELQKAAEQDPTRDSFGQPLRDALSGTNKVNLDTKLNQLQQAQEANEKRQRAGEASQSLAQVSKAFSASEPKAMQMAGKSDSLKPSGQDSLNMGMAELESLIKAMEENRQLPKDSQGKQSREALFNLQSGLRSFYGDNEKGNQIAVHLEKALKAEALNVGDLKKLMDELQHFSVETSDHLAKKDDKPDITNIDPT
ncbi:MAG TPA: hypothetical protein VLT36_13975, partial [Candidatus Dormibacteraeota bacterium]|nr:hypothetical protein [Candidatus Dormibacteraeota bacterium]